MYEEKQDYVVSVGADGNLIFIRDETLAFLEESGRARTSRASHVEPANMVLRRLFHLVRRLDKDGTQTQKTRQWKCKWRVNMEPVGGPVLPGTFTDRTDALAAEVRWLEMYYL